MSAVLPPVPETVAADESVGPPGLRGRWLRKNPTLVLGAVLLLLMAISLTGLMLTFSTHFLRGAGYSVLSLVHAVTVSATLYVPDVANACAVVAPVAVVTSPKSHAYETMVPSGSFDVPASKPQFSTERAG